jgi:arsenate reductase-like glutaredoxin family protein
MQQGANETLKLAKSVDKVIVARGKKVVAFDMKKSPPDDETLLAHLLGPTGNLRAPALRKGRTLLVGFSDDAYAQVLGRDD